MIVPAFYPQEPMMWGNIFDDRYQKYNFDICRAIDLTSLSVVLDRMVEDGWCDKQMAAIYFAQAEALLAALRSENGRCHANAIVRESKS